MGQEHSVPAPRRMPNKLSKPRTNSSGNLLSRSTLQLGKDGYTEDVPGQGNRFSVIFADPEIRVEPQGERKDGENKRRSVFRSWSTPDKQTLMNRAYETQAIEDDDVPQWEEKSRHNSMLEEPSSHYQQTSSHYQQPPSHYQQSPRPVNASRMSLQHVPTYHDRQRLSRVTEVSIVTPEPEPAKPLTTYAELRSPTMTNPPVMDFPRNTSETDLFMPTRRRSFQQHGVATRPNLDDSRQSLPSQMNAPLAVPPYPSNSRLPVAYLASLRQQDMPRVETPDDVDYRHTGAFKLGSLRITNGVASPTPSIERAVTMSGGEDYISAGHVRRISKEHFRAASNRSNTLSIAGEKLKSPWIVREESPLRKSQKYSDAPPRLDDSILDLDSSLADFDFDSTLESLKDNRPSTSEELADGYIQDIALSPYSFAPSRTPSPYLEPTSKHTAIEDQLFDAEPVSPALSHTPSNADSGYEAPSRKSSGPRQKTLAKADSGYSSNFSVRSLKSREGPPPPVPPKDYPPAAPRESVSRVASSTYSTAEKSSLSTRADSTPPSKPKQSSEAPVSVRDQEYHAIVKSISRVSNVKQVTVPQPKKEKGSTSRSSLLGPRSILDAKKKHTRSGSDPKGNATNPKLVSNKKKKQRPYSVQPEAAAPIFTIQAQGQDEEINVPPVSSEAARHLENRVDSFPMSSFTNNFKGLRRNGSKETLGTIFSVGSGFTEAPKKDASLSRVTEAPPLPPTEPEQPLATSNSYYPPKTPPKKLRKRSSINHDMAAYQDLDFGLVNSLTQNASRISLDSGLGHSKPSQSRTLAVESDVEKPMARSRNSAQNQSSISKSNHLDRRVSLDTVHGPSKQSQSMKSEVESDVQKPSISSRISSQNLTAASKSSKGLHISHLTQKDHRVSLESGYGNAKRTQSMTSEMASDAEKSTIGSRVSSQNLSTISKPSKTINTTQHLPQNASRASLDTGRGYSNRSRSMTSEKESDVQKPAARSRNSSLQSLNVMPNSNIPPHTQNHLTQNNGRVSIESGYGYSNRSRSMTSDMESDSEQPMARSRNSSYQNLNVAAFNASRLNSIKSYDSISSQEVHVGHPQSTWNISPAPLSAPLEPSQSSQYLNTEAPEQRRLSWGNRDKKQPPVSMQTQRKVTPTVNAYNLFPAPPRPGPHPIVPVAKARPRAPTLIEQIPDTEWSVPLNPSPAPTSKSLPPSPLPIQMASPLPNQMPSPMLFQMASPLSMQMAFSPLPIQMASPQQMFSPLPSPLPPHKDSPRPFNEESQSANDPWAQQRSYWSDRRQLANDSVQSQRRPSLPNYSAPEPTQNQSEEQERPSLSNRHSSSSVQSRGYRRPPSVHQNGNLRIQKSMEAVRAKQFMEQKMYMQSTPNLRQANESQDPNNPKSGSLADLRKTVQRKASREELRRQRERDTAGEMLAGWQQKADGSTPGEYHNTYGLPLPISPYYNKENRAPSPEKEYFSQPTAYSNDDFAHYQEFNRRQNSTSDMLVLDRFSGGLGYGYESGYGVGGSAGTRGKGVLGGGGRKSVDVSRTHGLDFTDVPVYFTQVPGSNGYSEVRYQH